MINAAVVETVHTSILSKYRPAKRLPLANVWSGVWRVSVRPNSCSGKSFIPQWPQKRRESGLSEEHRGHFISVTSLQQYLIEYRYNHSLPNSQTGKCRREHQQNRDGMIAYPISKDNVMDMLIIRRHPCASEEHGGGWGGP